MKKLFWITSLSLGLAWSATAATYRSETYTSGFENGGNIPNGEDSLWSDLRTVSGITELTVGSVSVRLNISGGANGDLYCYLSHGGILVPLLNRVGVGTGNAYGYEQLGLNVTFTDTAANNIHFYQAIDGYSITGGASWQPDGRTINPVTSAPVPRGIVSIDW